MGAGLLSVCENSEKVRRTRETGEGGEWVGSRGGAGRALVSECNAKYNSLVMSWTRRGGRACGRVGSSPRSAPLPLPVTGSLNLPSVVIP